MRPCATTLRNPTLPVNHIYYIEIYSILIICFRCEVIVLTNDTRANIIDKVKGVDAIFWNTHNKLDKEILDAAGKTFNFFYYSLFRKALFKIHSLFNLSCIVYIDCISEICKY